MSRKKKIFLIAYVIILIAIITFILNKIFAASSGISTYGTRRVISAAVGDRGTEYVSASDSNFINSTNIKKYITLTNLQDNNHIFCTEKLRTLLTNDYEELRKVYKSFWSSNINYIFNNGATGVSDVNGKSYSDVTGKDVVNLLGDLDLAGMEGETDDYKFYSKKLDLDRLEIKNADKNKLGWAARYILAHANDTTYANTWYDDIDNDVDADSNFENTYTSYDRFIKVEMKDGSTKYAYLYNSVQWALWAVLGGTENNVDEVNNIERKHYAYELYKKAIAFETYRELLDDETPHAENNNIELKAESGNYIVGPIKISYMGLNSIYNGTSIRVGKIPNYTLKGKDHNNVEKIIDKTKYQFVNSTGTQEYTFLPNGTAFYIKIDNEVAENISELTSFSVDFEYLDADEPIVYELKEKTAEGAIQYYEWTLKGNTLTRGNLKESTNMQTVWFLGKASLFWQEYNLEIPFGGLKLGEPDLALRKFITAVNGEKINSREPKVNTTPLKNKTGQTAIYNHPKNPLEVNFGDIVEFTIRVYNEGDFDGYATVIEDYLPKGLEFLPDNQTNMSYNWRASQDGRTVRTDCLRNEVISAYNNGNTLDYKDVKIVCRVMSIKHEEILTNIAQIFADNLTGKDRDSAPNNLRKPTTDSNLSSYTDHQEDDDDFEKLKVNALTDIGGKVWVDQENSKTDEPDGKLNTGADYPRQNVEVRLYNNQGKLLTKNDVANESKSNFVNPTYTDSTGNYTFKGVYIDGKYYVEFIYDGMTYTTTQFLADDGNINNYKSNPENYLESSMAEETPNNRNTFNNKFAEIYAYNKQYNPISDGRTQGSTTRLNMIEYISKEFTVNGNNLIQSRLITTDNENDVNDNVNEKGKALENYKFTVSTKDKSLIYPFFDRNGRIIIGDTIGEPLKYLQHINLGLNKREKADLRLGVDVTAAGTSIKDKTKLVKFPTYLDEDSLAGNVDAAQVDQYIMDLKNNYGNLVLQDISASDYYWHTKIDELYSDDNLGYEIIKDELNVYVLYKILIENQSDLEATNATVTGLVDYFSDGLIIPGNEDMARIKKIFGSRYSQPNDAYSWTADGTAINWTDAGTTNGYNKITTNQEFEIGASGDKKEIYLVLKVGKTGALLTENNLENIAEITSYKFHDASGSALGLVDRDSAPYNATPGNINTYEDDTDNARTFKLNVIWNPKKIEGYVLDNSGSPVSDAKVELIEYLYNDNGAFVRETVRSGIELDEANKTIGAKMGGNLRTDSNGHYEFYVEAGNYSVRFTYGDTEMLENNSKYNAQDYQAVKENYEKIYRHYAGMDLENKNSIVNTTSNVELNKNQTLKGYEEENWNNTNHNTSNARDLANIRKKVIESAYTLNYTNASILDKLGKADLTDSEREILSGNDNKENINYTYMQSVSDIVIVNSNEVADASRYINLYLQERVQASRKLEKTVDRIILTAADGTVLVDTDDETKLSGMQKLSDIQNTFTNLNKDQFEGATIDIDYTITATNDSAENDTLSNYVYVDSDRAILNGTNGYNLSTPLPIQVTIYDYVNKNLEYRLEDNEGNGWKVVFDNDRETSYNTDTEIPLAENVRNALPRTSKKVSKVLKDITNSNINLTKDNSITKNIHLSMTLAESVSDSGVDDYEFINAGEIVQVVSAAGRRDYETVPGNNIPYADEYEQDQQIIDEDDYAQSGITVITEPLGQTRIYYVITIISATILIVGIVLIKKKVLKK